ncbi:MAG TPA: ankyrin repeat domain-containing protein [Rariglobus sp.]
MGKGAKRDAVDAAGYTPLMRAVEGGHEEAVQRLLARGAKLEGITKTGLTLVDLAAASGNLRCVRMWDSEGKYQELLEQFPPLPKSPWIGDWVAGEGETHTVFHFDGDGTGRWRQNVFAWRQTEDGVSVRLVMPHPKVRGFTQTHEIALVADGEGGLRLATRSSSPDGERMWMLRRAGKPAPDLAARQERENRRQAEEQSAARLAALRSGQSTDLYLDGIGLSALPEELLAEARWTGVSISWQELKVLPAGVSRWRGVERLSLVNQRGLVIEAGALALPKLTALEIRNTRLAILPLKLEAVPGLTELNVSDNRLTELPSGWGKMSACRSVLATGNRLRSLPADLGEAVSLQMLNVSENQLSDLPASLERAPLETLAMERNGLVQVPAVIGRLRGLTYLSLADNRLSALPATITSLVTLEGLDLSANRLTTLPELRESRGLKRLSLRGNLIAELPDDPACIPASVTELDLSGNRLARVPAWVEARGFARLSLRGNLFSDEEARRIARASEEAWRVRRK